jgi:hypothetical protein
MPTNISNTTHIKRTSLAHQNKSKRTKLENWVRQKTHVEEEGPKRGFSWRGWNNSLDAGGSYGRRRRREGCWSLEAMTGSSIVVDDGKTKFRRHLKESVVFGPT